MKSNKKKDKVTFYIDPECRQRFEKMWWKFRETCPEVKYTRSDLIEMALKQFMEFVVVINTLKEQEEE